MLYEINWAYRVVGGKSVKNSVYFKSRQRALQFARAQSEARKKHKKRWNPVFITSYEVNKVGARINPITEAIK